MTYRNRVSLAEWACADGGPAGRETDGYGCQWTLNGITGWFEAPTVRAQSTPRPDDGSWDGPVTFDSRTVTVLGTVHAPDGPALQAAMDRVGNLLAGLDRLGTLVVDEAARGLSRQATVRLNRQPLLNRLGSRDAAFSVSLTAADSRRYSTELHSVLTGRYVPAAGVSFPVGFPADFGGLGSGGIVHLTNAGTQPTPVLIYLYGPLTNPVVRWVEGNRTIGPRMTLAQGQTLVIDTAEPSIMLGSSSRRQLTTPCEYFQIPPGDSTLYLSADDGTGSMAVFWRDAT